MKKICQKDAVSFRQLFRNIANLQIFGYFVGFYRNHTIHTSSVSNAILIVLSGLFLVPGAGFIFAQPIQDLPPKQKPPLIFPLSKYPKFELSDEDIADVIKNFKTKDPSDRVRQFQEKLEKPLADDNLKKEVTADILKLAGKNHLEDKKLELKIKKLFAPVLKLYNREDTYDFIILRHPTPFMMISASAVIVLTTGLITEAASTDELLGYIAHEVGHEYFFYNSRYTKHLFELGEFRYQETTLNRHIVSLLGIIELQCDGFAAITLAHLKMNPVAFLKGTERTEKSFEMDPNSVHPKTASRIKFAGSILTDEFYKTEPVLSDLLVEIKRDLKQSFQSVF